VAEKSLDGPASRYAAPLAYHLLDAGLFSRDTSVDEGRARVSPS
jgi:hypothetical protein